jgi:DNA-binding response OmpR family regulator
VRVLVVEDDDDIRSLLVHVLESAGHEPTAAGTGEQAVRLAAARRPDVVLLDLGLPDKDGWAVARRLDGTPVVVLSVSDEDAPDDVEVAARLTKPFRARDVQAAIARVTR